MLHIAKNISVNIIDIGFSILIVSFWNFTGLIIADSPNISNKLHTLLPITFPIDMSERPCNADDVLTNSSGIDVPIDTIVNPIIISDIRIFLAIALDPFTSTSAPFINIKNPNIISTISIII